MSWFGDGTFKQTLLEELEGRQDQFKLDRLTLAQEAIEVVSYMLGSAVHKDKEMKSLYDKAYAQARADIIAGIQKQK